MTTINIPAIKATTRITAVARTSIRSVIEDPKSNPPVPIDLYSYQPEDGFMWEGHPIVPKMWARAQGIATTDGEYVDSDRPTPRDVPVDCHSRFLPGTDLYDDIAGVWRPFFTKGADYYWATDPTKKPTADEVQYRIGKELITLDCLAFQAGDYLYSSFNTDNDSATEYTIVMVLSFDGPANDAFFASYDRTLWLKETIELTDGFYPTVKIKTVANPTQIDPMVLIVSVRPPNTKIWIVSPDRKVAYSPSLTQQVAQGLSFTIGRDIWVSTGTVALKLLEWTMFEYAVQPTTTGPNQLNLNQMIALYSSMYGAL